MRTVEQPLAITSILTGLLCLTVVFTSIVVLVAVSSVDVPEEMQGQTAQLFHTPSVMWSAVAYSVLTAIFIGSAITLLKGHHGKTMILVASVITLLGSLSFLYTLNVLAPLAGLSSIANIILYIVDKKS